MRAGASVGVAGANGGSVLREGCSQGGSFAAAITIGTSALSRHSARATVQADRW